MRGTIQDRTGKRTYISLCNTAFMIHICIFLFTCMAFSYSALYIYICQLHRCIYMFMHHSLIICIVFSFSLICCLNMLDKCLHTIMIWHYICYVQYTIFCPSFWYVYIKWWCCVFIYLFFIMYLRHIHAYI